MARAAVPEPPAGHRRPTSPDPSATSCWSATPDRARRRWSRRCSRDRDHHPGRPRRGRHDRLRLRRGRAPPAALGLPRARPRSCTTASRSTCSTPPGTPTSSATCGPACAPPTRPCSSSRPSTGSTARPACCGRSARRSGCRAPSSSPSWTRTRADFDESVAICQRVFGDGVLPLYLPMARRRRHASAGLIGLLSQQVFDYSSGARGPSATRTPSTCRRSRSAAQRADRGDHRRERGRDPDGPLPRRRGHRRQVLIDDLETAVARGSFYPVLAAALTPGRARHAPSCSSSSPGRSPPRSSTRCPPVTTPDGPPAGPLACDPDGPLVAEVVKTTTDPYVGRISPGPRLLRHAAPGHTVHVSGHGLGPSAATRTTTSTSGSARCPRRSARPSARPASASPATSCAVAKLAARRDRRHPVATRTTRC